MNNCMPPQAHAACGAPCSTPQIQAEQQRPKTSQRPTTSVPSPSKHARPVSASYVHRPVDSSSSPGYQAPGLAPGVLTGGPSSTQPSSLSAALRLYAGLGGRSGAGSKTGMSAVPRPATSQPFSSSTSPAAALPRSPFKQQVVPAGVGYAHHTWRML